jgi:TonB family protein
MKKLILLAVCFLTSPAYLIAQLGVAPVGTSSLVKWERYRDDHQNVSILFPKTPIAVSSFPGCSEVSTTTYFTYAQGVVYSLTINSKKRNPYPCPTNEVTFDRQLLLDRIAKLSGKTRDDATVIAAATDGQKTNFSNDRVNLWVIPEMSKNRWIEIVINRRANATTNEKEFVESLELKSDQGKPIGDGAEATIGDPYADGNDASPTNPPAKAVTDPVIIVAKPRANYTDVAREHNVQGVVRLHLELLRNGSVGNIEVVDGLKFGLTEQAIAAARKIVFLPRQVNGVRVDSIVTFEYSFTIY